MSKPRASFPWSTLVAAFVFLGLVFLPTPGVAQSMHSSGGRGQALSAGGGLGRAFVPERSPGVGISGRSFEAARPTPPPAMMRPGGMMPSPPQFQAPVRQFQAPARMDPGFARGLQERPTPFFQSGRLAASSASGLSRSSSSGSARFSAPSRSFAGSSGSSRTETGRFVSPHTSQPLTVPERSGSGATGSSGSVRMPGRGSVGGGLTSTPRVTGPALSSPRAAPQTSGMVFRGPEAHRTVRLGDPQTPQHLQSFVREHNSARTMASPQVLPARDRAGNTIPRGTTVLNRGAISGISKSFNGIQRTVGHPTNGFLVRPRHFFGRGEEEEEEKEHHFHSFFFIDFFLPFYFNDPFWSGFDRPGFYPSVCSHYGWCPGWIYPDRAYYDSSDYTYYGDDPYRYYHSGSALDYSGAGQAIDDIRNAWVDSDISLLSGHLTDQLDARVYFNGEYAYSTATQGYYSMTADIMSTTQTVSVDFGDPIWISSREMFYAGRHVFNNPNGATHTVYISYRLRRLGSDWYIVAVGTSAQPIESHYSNSWQN